MTHQMFLLVSLVGLALAFACTGREPTETFVPLEAAAPEVDAFFLACDTMIQGGGEEVVIQVARKYQLPTLSCNKSSVFKGALVGDVADFANIGALAGEKAVQVLNGTHPSNLISETQRGSYLMVNRSTANHLELSISDSLLSLTSEVID